MAEMAQTGVAEPAAGNIPGSAIRIEALQETLRHPSGTQGLNPSTDVSEIMIVRIT